MQVSCTHLQQLASVPAVSDSLFPSDLQISSNLSLRFIPIRVPIAEVSEELTADKIRRTWRFRLKCFQFLSHFLSSLDSCLFQSAASTQQPCAHFSPSTASLSF